MQTSSWVRNSSQFRYNQSFSCKSLEFYVSILAWRSRLPCQCVLWLWSKMLCYCLAQPYRKAVWPELDFFLTLKQFLVCHAPRFCFLCITSSSPFTLSPRYQGSLGVLPTAATSPLFWRLPTNSGSWRIFEKSADSHRCSWKRWAAADDSISPAWKAFRLFVRIGDSRPDSYSDGLTSFCGLSWANPSFHLWAHLISEIGGGKIKDLTDA